MRFRSTSIAPLALFLVATACGGSEPSPAPPLAPVLEPPPAAEPGAGSTEPPPAANPAAEPVKLTTAQIVKAHDDCWEAFFNRKDEKKVADCQAENVVEEDVDQGMPTVNGRAASVKSTKEFWAAFPDLGGEQVLTLASGNNIAIIGRMGGTNTGSMMGKPPTNKKIGLLGVEIVEATDDGKHQRTRVYYDGGTMLAQLGVAPIPKFRPALDKSTAERKLVVASADGAKEKASMEAAQKCVDAWNDATWKDFEACTTKDFSVADQLQPADHKGKNAIEFLKGIKKAFPDGKLATSSKWAAGDYVVAEQTFTGTNKGSNPQMGIKKATDRKTQNRMVQIFRVQDGKVAEVFQVGNGMSMAMQLGLVSEPGKEPPPAEKGKKGDKGDKGDKGEKKSSASKP